MTRAVKAAVDAVMSDEGSNKLTWPAHYTAENVKSMLAGSVILLKAGQGLTLSGGGTANTIVIPRGAVDDQGVVTGIPRPQGQVV